MMLLVRFTVEGKTAGDAIRQLLAMPGCEWQPGEIDDGPVIYLDRYFAHMEDILDTIADVTGGTWCGGAGRIHFSCRIPRTRRILSN